MVEERREKLKALVLLGRDRGCLTRAEVMEHFPHDILDAEQVETILSMIRDMNIEIQESHS
jgi:RNA polymerase primary sigma factor